MEGCPFRSSSRSLLARMGFFSQLILASKRKRPEFSQAIVDQIKMPKVKNA
jgi:hypothetical protein